MLVRAREFSVSGCVMVAGLAMAWTAATSSVARADFPAALDRVPSNAAFAVGVANVDEFRKESEKLGAIFGGDEGGPTGGPGSPMNLKQIKSMLDTPGLNGKGSMAFAVVPDAEGKIDFKSQTPQAVMIVPISDYKAFGESVKVDTVDGVGSFVIGGRTSYCKDIGGGYAAIAQQEALLKSFEGKAGNKAAHEAALGANGKKIADANDVLVIANVVALQKEINDGIAKMKEGMKSAAAMAEEQSGGVGGPMLEALPMMLENWAKDAQVGVVGFNITEGGVAVDLGTQFKTDSMLGKMFAEGGKGGSMMTHLPKRPFLFAIAMDMTNGGLRQMVKNYSTMSTEAEKKAAEAAAKEAPGVQGEKKEASKATDFSTIGSLAKMADQVDSAEWMLASSNAGLAGGLFTNMVTYVATKDVPGYVGGMKKAIEGANGHEVMGITTKATYTTEAATVEGVKVDYWGLEMSADPNDPMAAQMQMIQGFMYGGNAMNGITAAVDGGVVTTASRNTKLLTAAIGAAKNGDGLASEAAVKTAQGVLQSNRAFELHLGAREIMTTVNDAMATFTGDDLGIDLPEKLAPISVGGTMDSGGMTLRLFMPNDVMKMIKDLRDANADMMGEPEEMGEPDAKPAEEPAPKF
jgi:hypothetical protein